jgi:SAM-dependent methyltransferase
MTTQIYQWAQEVRDAHIHKIEGMKVLEIGALNINGSVRDIFEQDEVLYIGTDMMAGPGVDTVIDGHDLMDLYEPKSFDLVICLETFEHDINFWVTLSNIRRLTKPGGFLMISTPTFKFPLHRHPFDYYRFGEDAYRKLFFQGYEILDLREVVSKGVNPGIVCLGRKPL